MLKATLIWFGDILPKEVVQYANSDNPDCCIVWLYKPEVPFQATIRCFLSKAYKVNPKSDEYWYDARAVGHNILAGTVKRLCQEAGLQGHFTNHSLWSTAATRLFEAGVDEQLIMLRTGHSTASSVRSYKHVGEKLKSVTADVLNGANKFKQDSEYLEGVKQVDEPVESVKNGNSFPRGSSA